MNPPKVSLKGYTVVNRELVTAVGYKFGIECSLKKALESAVRFFTSCNHGKGMS